MSAVADMPAVVDELQVAREVLDEVCVRLLSPSPESHDCCNGLLDKAVHGLSACREELRHHVQRPAEALSQVRGVRHSLGKAARLLQMAFLYHSRWQQIMLSMTGGYTASGVPTPRSGPARIWMEG